MLSLPSLGISRIEIVVDFCMSSALELAVQSDWSHVLSLVLAKD